MNRLLFLSVLTLNGNLLVSQTDQSRASKDRFIQYYAGDWAGSGQFSNGTRISARINFQYDKDVDGILYRHTDDPPHQYRSLSVWKIDSKTEQLIASIHDPFGRVRVFVSKEWKDRKLTFESVNLFGEEKFTRERFLYEPLTETSFKMTYQVNDGSAGWRVGDWLVFQRSADSVPR